MKKLTTNSKLLLLIFYLNLYSTHLFAENTKLHIATNKEFYTEAEIIHFQLFLLNPGQKTNNSVFVELLDCNGKKLSKQMLPFAHNTTSGSIALPEKTNAAFYLLYCYVINYNSIESSNIKKILIQGNQVDSTDKPENKTRIFHYFEGGTFIAESPNNLLIRCVDDKGFPVIAKGKITDGKNNIYAVFTTDKMGFAKTIINPEDKVKYQIEILDSKNQYKIKHIPPAESTGITLNTGITQGSIQYTVISYSLPGDPLPDYRIEALQNGLLVYDAAISFQNGLSVVKDELKTESLPAGFICFRILDKSNKILAQRIIYNPGLQNNAVTMLNIIDTINKKEARVMLPEIVSGKAYINIKTESNITNTDYELLFLENTDGNNMPVNDQLIAATEQPNSSITTAEKINHYLSIEGTLLDFEKKPVKNKQVNLVIVHKNLKKDFLVANTDHAGKIQLDNLVFYDSVTVYYQLADKSVDKNNVYLELKVTPASKQFEHIVPPFHFICSGELTAPGSIITNHDEKTLKQVVVTAVKEKTESEKYADKFVSEQMKKSNGLINEFDFIKNPEIIDTKTLFSFLQTRMASLRIVITPQGNPVLTASRGGTVGVYLNDLELPLEGSLDYLNNLQVKDVALVKYYGISFKPKIIGGNPLTDPKASDGGDLLIYTKRDYMAGEEKTKGLPKTGIAGYYAQKPYSIPTVTSNDQESVFWKPEWKVETGQRIYIGLPLSDPGKDLEIIVEGINTYLAPYRFTQKLTFK